MIFATTGRSGLPKTFRLSDELVRERARLRAVQKGPEYSKLESLLVILRPGSTAHAAHEVHCKANGVKLYSSATHTMEQLIRARPQGIVGAHVDLLACVAAFNHRLKFDYILSGGDYLPPKGATAIRRGLLADGGSAYVTYGASEVGTISRATFSQVESQAGCVGQVCEGNEVQVIDGRVLIKTPVMIEGYEDPKLTAAHFFRGWFVPGDLGFFSPSGLLVLENRRPPKTVLPAQQMETIDG